ncbi:MAG: hypothetical protein AAF727_15995, partial [Pseudomonadota bacterium]
LTLLDPSSRPVVNKMITAKEVGGGVAGFPLEYGRADSKKYLIVMSDGANTQHWDLKPGFRTGPSPIFKLSGIYYYFNASTGLFYRESNGQTSTSLDSAAVNLTWPEVWDQMSVRYYAKRLAQKALGGSWQNAYYSVVQQTNSGTKNTRTSNICKAARDAGVTVYTIGVGTYGQGDATLLDCAGTEANFFDISPDELDEAFGAIARQINQLRLTQ